MKSFLVIFMINPFPLDTYNFLDDNDDYDKNNLSTPVENLFLDNKGAEDWVMTNSPNDNYNDEYNGDNT